MQKILDRLQRVKQAGEGRWIAACPAHPDRSPSLSIREVDGRILLHDFGGCEVGDILAALGLQLRDLFDKPITTNCSPSRSRIPPGELLQLLSHEIDVAVIVLGASLETRSVTETEWKRLAQVASRIGAARDLIHGR